MKGECNSKRKENFLSYYNLSDRIIFWIKQAASGNRKAVFIAPVGTVFIYENNAILCSANQSRDAKSCVSQAMIRYLFGRWNAFRCCVFCLWDARFCVSTGEDALFIGVMKCLLLLRFLLVRRKILRLYWADAIIISCKTQWNVRRDFALHKYAKTFPETHKHSSSTSRECRRNLWKHIRRQIREFWDVLLMC